VFVVSVCHTPANDLVDISQAIQQDMCK